MSDQPCCDSTAADWDFMIFILISLFDGGRGPNNLVFLSGKEKRDFGVVRSHSDMSNTPHGFCLEKNDTLDKQKH